MPFAVGKIYLFFSRAPKINHTVLCSHFLAAALVTCRFYYSLICWIDDIWKENEINRNHFDSLRAMWMCAQRNGANDKRCQRKNNENILCRLLRLYISSATIAVIKFDAIFFTKCWSNRNAVSVRCHNSSGFLSISQPDWCHSAAAKKNGQESLHLNEGRPETLLAMLILLTDVVFDFFSEHTVLKSTQRVRRIFD